MSEEKARTSYPLGVVYKVERDYTKEEIKAHLKRIRDCGFSIVVIWPPIYWWESKRQRSFPTEMGCLILKYAQEIGLKIIMELAGQLSSLEYAPDFFMKRKFFIVDEFGHHSEYHDGYYAINFNHPRVKKRIRRYLIAVAKAYRGFPALYGYDVWNETQFCSFDSHTMRAFQKWLRNRYGSLEKLNAVWDRCYSRWSQIRPSRWNWASVMPFVDYERFKRANIGAILQEWSRWIRSVDPNHKILADNVGSMISSESEFERPHDDWELSNQVDEPGMSLYPKYYGVAEVEYLRWMTLAGFRATAQGKNFWIAELQTHNTTLLIPQSAVKPEELATWVWETISQGAKGVIFWKWRSFIRGVQTFGRGLVNTQLEPTDRLQAVKRIGELLKSLNIDVLRMKPERAHAAALFDRQTQIFFKAFMETKESRQDSIYTQSLQGLFLSMWECNVPLDILCSEDVVLGKANGYRVLFVPNLMIVDDQLGSALLSYVEQGGTLICDGKFAEISENGRLFPRIPGGPMQDVVGYTVLDTTLPELSLSFTQEDGYPGKLRSFFEVKQIRVNSKSTSVEARFDNDWPAVLRTQYGQGEILHFATHLWLQAVRGEADALKALSEWLCERYQLHIHRLDDNRLKVAALCQENTRLVYIFNYTKESIDTILRIQADDPGSYLVEFINTGISKRVLADDYHICLSLSVPAGAVQIIKVGSSALGAEADHDGAA